MKSDSKNSIRFASINIEGDNHLDSVVSFLKSFRPDVVCFQELMDKNISLFEKELGMKCEFAPMCKESLIPGNHSTLDGASGNAIFTSMPIVFSEARYYVGTRDTIPHFYKNADRGIVIINKVLLYVTVSHAGFPYTFATTHFTWSKDGATTDEQRGDLKKLFKILDAIPDFVLSGDFNAPRGREIFSAIASRYKDNIPARYETSIDKRLHRAGDLQLMVDGLFSTPQYTISSARLNFGVSDHAAITAEVSRA